jgi:DNA-directed RNA polymerase subunit RPC12/RpoP
LIVAFSFLGIFFEAAVVGCTSIRLDGGDPRIKDGFGMAAKRGWQLFKWALMGLAVGLILGAIRGTSRTSGRTNMRSPGLLGNPRFQPTRSATPSGFNKFYGSQNVAGPGWGLGDIISGVLGMAWSMATFFVIPAIIFEELPPLKAVKRSWEIIKGVWRESLILKIGFGALFGLLSLAGLIPLFMGFFLGARVLPEPVEFEWMGATGTTSIAIINPAAVIAGISTSMLYWMLLACISFTIKGVLRAVLYKYSFTAYSLGEKKCVTCGSKVTAPDAIFCPNCGGKLETKPVEIPERKDEFAHLNKFLKAYI